MRRPPMTRCMQAQIWRRRRREWTLGIEFGGLLGDIFRSPDHAAPQAKAEIAAMRANYAGNVTLIDDCIGEALDCLKAKSAYDNTLIIFTSDHGEMNGDQGLIYKGNFLSSAVDIPFVIKPPRGDRTIPADAADAMVELIDAGTTILDYAGAYSPHWANGRSLRPLIEGASATHRDYVVSEFAQHTMIATSSWKCEFDPEDRPILLFDRRADRFEQCNLVEEPAERRRIAELHDLLLAHRRATSESRRIVMQPEDQRAGLSDVS